MKKILFAITILISVFSNAQNVVTSEITEDGCVRFHMYNSAGLGLKYFVKDTMIFQSDNYSTKETIRSKIFCENGIRGEWKEITENIKNGNDGKYSVTLPYAHFDVKKYDRELSKLKSRHVIKIE